MDGADSTENIPVLGAHGYTDEVWKLRLLQGAPTGLANISVPKYDSVIVDVNVSVTARPSIEAS
jgi:hypothetical protein